MADETSTTTEPTTVAPAQSAEAEPFDQERAMATIRKLRENEKAARAQSKELEDTRQALKALEDAKLSDQEKLAKKASDLEARLADLEAKRVEAETALATERRASLVVRIAATLGAHDPQDANFMAAVSNVAFDDNAEGQVKAAIEGLKKTKAYLFRQPGQTLTPFHPSEPAGPIPETDAQRRARIYGGGGANLFDPAIAKARGGGVIMPQDGNTPIPK